MYVFETREKKQEIKQEAKTKDLKNKLGKKVSFKDILISFKMYVCLCEYVSQKTQIHTY